MSVERQWASARLPAMASQASRLNRLPAAERGITIGDFLVPIPIGERISVRARHVALIVAGALLMALSANISIPVPGTPVPITGQTFSVLLVGGALGARRGILATVLYLALGLFLPVYADHKQGIAIIGSIKDGHVVLGATGGYLLGWDRRFGGALAAMALGNVVIYLFGVPWLMAATGWDLQKAYTLGVAPFLLGDLIKLILAAGLFPIAWWVVGRSNEER